LVFGTKAVDVLEFGCISEERESVGEHGIRVDLLTTEGVSWPNAEYGEKATHLVLDLDLEPEKTPISSQDS